MHELMRAEFPTTHWSLLRRAGVADRTEGARALNDLLIRYLPALRMRLVAGKRFSADRADDILQSFVAAKFLERNLVATADAARGKFRTLLLTALERFVIDRWRAEPDGGPVEIDAPHLPPLSAADADPGQQFDVAWAREVISAALDAMRRDCETAGRGDVWQMFSARVVRPLMENVAPADYAQLAREMSIPSPSAASNLLVTAKRSFARALRSVVAQYALSAKEIDEEIRDLQRILSEAGAAGG